MAHGPPSPAASGVAPAWRPAQFSRLAGPVLLVSALLWAYWPTLGAMAEKWSSDPQYSHGSLVVVFAAVLLGLRRGRLAGVTPRPSWWGVPLLAAGTALHLAGAYFYFDWIDMASLFPSLAGLCLALAGGR